MHLLSINDLSANEMLQILSISERLEKQGKVPSLKKGKILCLLFEKPSTRTRISFEAAARGINLGSLYIDATTTHLSRGETLGDTGRVLSMYVDAIAARMYRQSDIEALASESSVPLINALTDLEHPCQSLSDLYTIKHTFRRIRGLRIAFVGDIATNTANSLMLGATKLGAEFVLVGPKGWKPNAEYVKKAESQSSVKIYDSMREGLKDVDVIYTDTFVSMGREAEAEKRRRIFKPYQINRKAVGYAKESAIVMHCLPAHRGEEITSDVLDGRRSAAWIQAANKLVVEKAILLYILRRESKDAA